MHVIPEIQDNAMLKLSLLSYCVNELLGTNYVPNEHEDVDQYDSYAIPSKIMPCWSYPESLVNQNEIPVELSC